MGGQCAGCSAWNSLAEEIVQQPAHARYQGYATGDPVITPMTEIALQDETARLSTGSSELDRVLGVDLSLVQLF